MTKISNQQQSFKTSFIQIPAQYSYPTKQELECENFINSEFNWLKDKTLKKALQELYYAKFDIKDISHLHSMGINLPFDSGEEVVNFLSQKNVRINFDKVDEPDIHAHYNFVNNTISINEKYKNSTEKGIILAIASAILHEAAHAKDKDGITSIQEELDCLAMNAIAHKNFLKKNPEVFKNLNQPIINDGVGLYAQLFFDENKKNELTSRVCEKYGILPTGCAKHPASELAKKIKLHYFTKKINSSTLNNN